MRLILRATLLLVCFLPAAMARAACPENLCDCLGQAARFGAVASQFVLLQTEQECGHCLEGCYVNSAQAQDVCSVTARLTALREDPYGSAYVDVGENLILLAGLGTRAARLRTDAANPEIYAETIATGGGSVLGPYSEPATVDTSGSHPLVATCSQAMDDAAAASVVLDTLTPTQELGAVYLKINPVTLEGGYYSIQAGPGVNVVTASKIVLKPYYYYGDCYEPSRLSITLHPETEALIINTPVFKVDRGDVTVTGDPARVIVNLAGPGAAVHLRSAVVETPILAPARRVFLRNTIGGGESIFAAQLKIRGGTVSNTFEACQ